MTPGPHVARALRFAFAALLAAAGWLAPAQGQTAGTLDPTFTAALNGGGIVNAMAMQPDGKTVIGGFFTTVGGAAHRNIARLNTDGSVDASFTASTDSDVYSVAVQADGKIVIGGFFSTVNGTTRNNFARLNADGSLESVLTFNLGTGANSTVYSVAVQANGKILIGGNFTSINGTAINRIARLNANGTLESSATFNPGSGANDSVYCIAVQPDGKIVLGGFFTTVSGTAIRRIARLNANGTMESTTTFNPGSGANASVLSVAVQADGKIILGGDFNAINSTTRNRIARLNGDGSLESTATFNPGTGANFSVFSVAVQADGKIILGGDFNTINSTTSNFIARLNGDGTLEGTATFDSGTGANSYVTSAAGQADGKIMLGGLFSTINGAPRAGLARLLNDAATQSLTAPDTAQVLWNRGGAAPEVSAVTFEKSTDGGITWAALGAATRVGTSANWQLPGLSLPTNGTLRARGRTASGYHNGGSGLIEQISAFTAVDVTAPTTTITSSTPAANSTSATIAFTGTDNVAVTSYEGQLDGTTFATVASPVSLTALSQGAHTYSVRARDAAGNVDATPATVTWTVDTIAPVVTGPGNLTVHATSPAGAVVSFTPTASDAVGVASLTSVPASGATFPAGTTTVTVTARDAANNAGTGQFTVTVTPLTPAEAWRYAAFGTAQNSGAAADGADPDGDGLINALELGLGTDPQAAGSGAGPLEYAGTFAGNGTIVRRGSPRVMSEGADVRVLYVRRVDAAALGLSYAVECSESLGAWAPSGAMPVVLADDGVWQIVSEPLPAWGGDGHYVRLRVALAP